MTAAVPIRTRTTAVAAAVALLLSLALAGRAHAFIYSSGQQGPLILRHNQDGSHQVPLVNVPGALMSRIAIDAGHIYWVDRGAGSIGRANIDGSSPQPAFIPNVGGSVSAGSSSLLQGIAVDGGHVYWTVGAGNSSSGSIGVANLDGSNPTTLVPNITAIEVAVDAGHLYWTGFGSIGRANIDGTGVTTNFINAVLPGFAPAPLLGLTVDGAHVFWSNSSSAPTAPRTIGRANIDGTAVSPSFIVPGGTNALLQAVAVDGGHVYWVDTNNHRIGRAGTDGSSPEPAFVEDAFLQQGGLAVDNAGLRSTSTSVSCAPGTVAIFGITTCTATVTDTSPGAVITPAGTAGFHSSHADAGVFVPSSCTLSAGIAPGTATCTVSYQSANPDDFPPPRTDVISAGYAPTDVSHAASASNGVGNVNLSVVPPDSSPPVINCATADGQWHAANVSIACTASDAGSGLANAGDASFSLSTSVAAGNESASAATNSRQVCDLAGNCATAGPVTGNKVDRKAPTVTLTSPGNRSYSFLGTLLAPVTASYSCGDSGSGIATCNGTQANGAKVDTGLLAILSSHSFTVTATDKAGNTTSVTNNYTVGL